MRVRRGHVAGGKGSGQGMSTVVGPVDCPLWREAFQLGHGGFSHLLEIPGNGPQRAETDAGGRTENHVQ